MHLPPQGYRTLTVRSDVAELLGRAKRLFHKTQIQILLEAVSEYISRHHRYGTTVLWTGGGDAVAIAWSAGIFEALGMVYPHPAPAMKIAVEVSDSDGQLLLRLRDLWGGSLYKQKAQGKVHPNRKELWVWGLRSEQAKRFLVAILPYMKGTKEQAVRECLGRSDSSKPARTSAEEALVAGGRLSGAGDSSPNTSI